MRRADERYSERGTSLVLTLAFLSLFGIFVVTLLAYAATSFKTTVVVHNQGITAYAAAGAVDTAIQRIRPNINLGRDPSFGGPSCNLSYPSVDAQPAVTVQCNAQPGSGAVQPGANGPPNAILTLATGGETGIDVSGNGVLKTSGNVFSNSAITLENPQTVLDASDGSITARGACTPNPAAAPSQWLYTDLRCNFAGSDPDGNDPNYSSRSNEVDLTKPNPAPTCVVANSVLQFSPGYYTNVNAFQSPNYGNCAKGFLYLRPGAYYFDFNFDPAFSNVVWTMSGTIVGGQPKGWNPSTSGSRPPTPGTSAATSAGCMTAPDGATDGVQLILGGGSQLQVAGGASVELCPRPSGGAGGQIAMYGLTSGSATTQTKTLHATAAKVTGAPWSAPLSNAFQIGEQPTPLTVSAALARPGPNQTTTLTLSGYPSIPAGSIVTSVKMRVAHQETTPGDLQTLNATITPGGSAACQAQAVTANGGSALQTQTFDVTSCLNTPAKLSGFTIAYSASLNGGGGTRTSTLTLDGIELDATYTPPAFRAQSGCVVTPGGCGFLSFLTGGGNIPTFYVWGTTYAPIGLLDVNFKNNTTIAFDRGVIVRALRAAQVPPAGTPATFRLGSGRRVELIASVNGVRKLRAVVTFVDSSSVPGRIVKIVSWSVTR